MKLGQIAGILLALSLCMVTGCQRSAISIAPDELKTIDDVVDGEIEKGSFPGAVVLVGRDDKILYRRAFGNQLITPRKEAMNEDTVFDIASLTKPGLPTVSFPVSDLRAGTL